jgi:hypothetical protein
MNKPRPIDPLTGVRCTCERAPFLYHEDQCDVSKAYDELKAAKQTGGRAVSFVDAQFGDEYDLLKEPV